METGYNDFPKGWKEIDECEFIRTLMHYITKMHEIRQMYYKDENGRSDVMKGYTSAMLFEIAYSGWEDMGVAIIDDYINSSLSKVKFAKFGEEERWVKNERKFADQFAHDNS